MRWTADGSVRMVVSRTCDAMTAGLGCLSETRYRVDVVLRAVKHGETCEIAIGIGFCVPCSKTITVDGLLTKDVWDQITSGILLNGKPPAKSLTRIKFVEAFDG